MTDARPSGDAAAVLEDVVVRLAAGPTILGPLSLRLTRGEHRAVLGPNGSGKTTLAGVLSTYTHPSAGSVTILGERLGRTDTRALRRRIGLVGTGMADRLRGSLRARDLVVTAARGALEPWWHDYTDVERHRADELLGVVGCADRGDQTFASLSAGERQRVLLARALMPEPELLVLDEPAAGLDLGGREGLVATMDAVAARADGPTMVLITHHVEEIPPSFDRLLCLRDGVEVGSGPIDDTLDAAMLEATFEVPVRVERRAGRWFAGGF